MSTILRALEKANKAREDAAPATDPARLAAQVRERELRAQAEGRNRQVRLLAVVVLLLLVSLLVVAMMARPSRTVEVAAAAPPSPPAVASEPRTAAVAEPTPAPTPSPTPAPTPSPTPEPSPNPAPTPQPTPVGPPRTVYTDSQVVWGEQLGVRIQGVMQDGSNSIVMIDDTSVEIGRKYKNIRPLAVKDGLIEAEYSQPEGDVTLYIRY